ncbi:MAG: tRNA dihydrouridine synthase [bacterium]
MILAPMQGLTEVLFRRVYEECFPGAIALAVAPFLSLTHNLESSRRGVKLSLMDDVLPERNVGSIPVVPQILGKEPDEFIALSNRLYEMGYREVNWNMGCPVRKVAAKGRGCGLLPRPELVRSILEEMIPAIKPRLSVKVRLGLKDPQEIFRLVPVLNDYPLASVTVHPRLGRQQYGGVPDLKTFGEVLPLFKAPVVYNGDICTAADARFIRERFPQVVDIMVGRGVLYRPMLPLEIRNDESRIKHCADAEDDSHFPLLTSHFIHRLVEEIEATLPTEQSKLRKIKEYWCMLWKSLTVSEQQAREVLRQEKLTTVDKMIHDFLQ